MTVRITTCRVDSEIPHRRKGWYQMSHVIILILAVTLPLAYLLRTRSLTSLALALGFTVAITGSGIQTSIALGANWNFSQLQLLMVIALVFMLIAGWLVGKPIKTTPLRHQLLAIGVPIAIIGTTIVVSRLNAPGNPGALTAFGYLVNHTDAEDNAKWLNLTSQLATGENLSFESGYAGGPLLMLLIFTSTLAAALSSILFGGVSEVAVALNGVVGASLLLIILSPLALAPFAERRIPRGSSSSEAVPQRIPAVLIWMGALVLVAASATATTYGHLSLQLVLVFLTLWVVVFLVGPRIRRAHVIASLIAASAGVIWLPLNVLSLGLLALVTAYVIVQAVRALRRGSTPDWISIAAVVIAVSVYWDGLISSTVYSLGSGISARSSGITAPVGVTASVRGSVEALFLSPGGTAVVGPLLGILTIISIVASVSLLTRGRNSFRSQVTLVAPILLLVGYSMVLAFADGLITASSPNYSSNKMLFAVAVVLLASTVPIALISMDPRRSGLTLVRGIAVAAVVFALALDGLLLSAANALSPRLWAEPQGAAQGYWFVAEVNGEPNQQIRDQPIACVFLPPDAPQPTAQINGPLAYTCSRLLIGLAGRDGRVGDLMNWITNDWLGDGSFWETWYPSLRNLPTDISDRNLLLLDAQGQAIGEKSISDLLNQFRPVTSVE
jgi:flagellar biogenesis protein FliO